MVRGRLGPLAFLRQGRWLLAVLAALFILAGGGCNSDVDPEELDLGIIDFGDDESPESVSVQLTEKQQEVVEGVSVDPALRLEINYIFLHQVQLERLHQVNRDLLELAGRDDAWSQDLDWVIEVHEQESEARAFYLYLIGQSPPAHLVELYGSIQLGMLDVVELSLWGLDYLLASAVLVGPGGRAVSDLNEYERVEFDTSTANALFYLEEAQKLLEHRLETVGGLSNGLSLAGVE